MQSGRKQSSAQIPNRHAFKVSTAMATSILIVDKSAIARSEVREALEREGLFDTYYEAGDDAKGRDILASKAVDLIITDLAMGDADSMKFLESVKGGSKWRDIPVIILSACTESAMKVNALRSGASDYVTRPFDPGELAARVMIHLNIRALQEEMRRANELLTELSITDHLTHLYNRRYMMDMLSMEFERAQRVKGKLSLAFMDVDHFKLVNDTYGHQQGDMVLAAVAEVIQAELRRYDIAVRYGGEEFAVVLPATSLRKGVVVAERIRQAVMGIVFPPPIEYLSVTISLGVAALPGPHIDSVQALIRAADHALYRAKQNGRNRVEIMLAAKKHAGLSRQGA